VHRHHTDAEIERFAQSLENLLGCDDSSSRLGESLLAAAN